MRDEDELRDLLQHSTPDIPAPVDRVAEIGMRVRHTRKKRFLGVSAVAVLVAGLSFAAPSLLRASPTTPLQVAAIPEVSCPTEHFRTPRDESRPTGSFVPADALDISLCVLPLSENATPLPPRTITKHSGEMTAVLNALPGADVPDMCTLVGYDDLSLVLRYPGKDPVLVRLDRNCGVAVVDGQFRRASPQPIDAFLDFYRDELIAANPPETIKTPACAANWSFSEDRQNNIRHRHLGDSAYLPSPLIGVAVCSYQQEPGKDFALVKQASTRTGLDNLRAQINNPNPNLNAKVTRLSDGTDCGPVAPGRVYLVRMVDITGSFAEYTLWHQPCGFGNNHPGTTNDLVEAVEELLGRG